MSFISRFLVSALLVCGLATCLQAATSIQGTVGGRGYTASIPSGPPPAGGFPVIMVLHGGGGTGDRIARITGFDSYVDKRRFIAVYPDSGGRQWNDGRETTQNNGDDVAFLLGVIRDLAARGADPRRVFVVGASNGGMMVQRLACDAPSSFAAFGVVIANMPSNLIRRCQPNRGVPIMFFNATTDPLMPWNGGDIRSGMMRGVGGKVASTPQTLDFWAQVNGCSGEQVQSLPDRTNDGTSVQRHSFASCARAPAVLFEVDGGGHTWPGGPEAQRAIVKRVVGPTSQDISATATLLDFFSRYGL